MVTVRRILLLTLVVVPILVLRRALHQLFPGSKVAADGWFLGTLAALNFAAFLVRRHYERKLDRIIREAGDEGDDDRTRGDPSLRLG